MKIITLENQNYIHYFVASQVHMVQVNKALVNEKGETVQGAMLNISTQYVGVNKHYEKTEDAIKEARRILTELEAAT